MFPAIVKLPAPLVGAGTVPVVHVFALYVTVYEGWSTTESTKPKVLTTVPITTVNPHFPPAPIAEDAPDRQPNSVTTELVELYATSKIRFSSVLLAPVVELWNR